jgi:mRNA interferase MazF
VIPFTTKSGALRFPYTIRVEPSKANGLTHPSVLLVFQMRAIDTKRIVARLGRIEDKVMRETEEAMAKLLAIT